MEIVRTLYSSGCRDEILSRLPDRSWRSITHQAGLLGLRRENQGNSTLGRLLEDTPEAFYWIGFILADGYIHPRQDSLSFGLSHRDHTQVERFAAFVGTSVSVYNTSGGYSSDTKVSRVDIHNVHLIPKLAHKFDLRPRKTYNPPADLCPSNPDLFIAMLVGFIDGDGCITPRPGRSPTIMFENHESWKSIFQKWVKHLYTLGDFTSYSNRVTNLPRVSRDPKKLTVRLRLTNPRLVGWLNEKRKALALPVLERKWKVIPPDLPEKAKERSRLVAHVLSLRSAGLSYSTIAKEVGISRAMVGYFVRTFGPAFTTASMSSEDQGA